MKNYGSKAEQTKEHHDSIKLIKKNRLDIENMRRRLEIEKLG